MDNSELDEMDFEDIDLGDMGDFLDFDNDDLSNYREEPIGEGRGDVPQVNNPKKKSIVEILEDVFGGDESEVEGTKIGDETADENVDLDKYSSPLKSDDTDVQQGIRHMREQHRVNVDDNWDSQPAQRVLAKDNSDNTDATLLQYPIILLNMETTVMKSAVGEVMRTSTGGMEINIHMNMGGDAVFLGKCGMNHKTFRRLEQLGLRPTYYPSKGVTEKFNSEILFDPTIYNPRILEEIREIEDPLTNLIPDNVYEKKEDKPRKKVKETPNKVPEYDSVDLTWLNQLTDADIPELEEIPDTFDLPNTVQSMEDEQGEGSVTLDWS